MSDKPLKHDELCNKLFDFVYPDESTLSDDDVCAELKRMRIDTSKAKLKLKWTLDHLGKRVQNQQLLATARKQRLGFTDKLQELNKKISSLSLPQKINDLKQFIIENMDGEGQGVFCRKLEEVSSEEDLQSLAEDILLLEELDNDLTNDQ